MTPALRSRLEAERMFTAANMGTAYATGAIDALKRQENPEAFEAECLARVQAIFPQTQPGSDQGRDRG